MFAPFVIFTLDADSSYQHTSCCLYILVKLVLFTIFVPCFQQQNYNAIQYKNKKKNQQILNMKSKFCGKVLEGILHLCRKHGSYTCVENFCRILKEIFLHC